MKTLAKLVILLAVVALSVPAYGEILLYNIKEKEICDYEYEGGQWEIRVGSGRGYLVLDVDFLTGTIVEATSIGYWKEKGGTKWYDADPINLELVVVDAKRKSWVILEKIATPDKHAILMVAGTVKSTNVGSGQNQEVAKSLKGYNLNDETNGPSPELEMDSLSLKLHSKGTKSFNDPLGINGNFNDSVQEVVDYLESKGYQEEP
ncbi:MAG: hypothetical protein KAV87_13950 [Desulfobacteraceae bacterium]|nr:hypothetical protein [Desulfobacteraceae bacterium]